MSLALSEDQELLAKTAADFVAEHSPVSRVRALRDARDPVGFSRALWKQMAELGWVGIPLPEAHGGAGMGLAELAVVLEALGRSLAPEPFLSTVLLAGRALARGGSEAQQRAWLPRIAGGEAIASVAFQEPRSRYDARRVAARAERAGAGWRLHGHKIQVLDGHVADLLVVSARSAGAESDRDGIGLFLVRAGAPGCARRRRRASTTATRAWSSWTAWRWPRATCSALRRAAASSWRRSSTTRPPGCARRCWAPCRRPSR